MLLISLSCCGTVTRKAYVLILNTYADRFCKPVFSSLNGYTNTYLLSIITVFCKYVLLCMHNHKYPNCIPICLVSLQYFAKIFYFDFTSTNTHFVWYFLTHNEIRMHYVKLIWLGFAAITVLAFLFKGQIRPDIHLI